MKKLICLSALVSLLLSCTREALTTEGGPVECRITVECESLSEKSAFDDAALTKVSDVSIFVYREGRLIDDLFFDSTSSIQLTFPSSAGKYNVYMLANMGDLAAPAEESGLQDIKYSFDDYGQFGEKGFPMANSFLSYVPGSSVRFKLKRLVGIYRIKMEDSSEVVEYSIRSICLRNCALDVFPLAQKQATSFILEGDKLSDEDIRTLNDGGYVDLYFLENLQGELLPGNTDPTQKIPANLPDADVAGRCTYIQIMADVTTPTAHFDNVFYRVYLGQNLTTDFTIKRSTLYSLSLNFATNMVADEGWRIEPEDPEVVGDILLDKRFAHVLKGFDDVIFISTSSANGKEVEYDVIIDTLAASQANLTFETYDAGGGKQAIRFSTSTPVDGLGSFDRNPDLDAELVPIRIVSKDTYNGVPTIEKNAVVKVYHKIFPIYLKAEYEKGEWILYMYSRNPLRLPFNIDYKTFSGQEYDGFVTAGSSQGWSPSAEGECTKMRIGSLGTAGLYSGGLRLDLQITPLVRKDVYPNFIEGTKLYLGEETEAYFGPGPYLYPGYYPDLYECNTERYSSIGGTVVPGTTGDFYALYYYGETNFYMSSKCPGWNRCNSFSLSGFYSGHPCPFYFVNGDLEAFDHKRYLDQPKYLDDSARQGIEIYAYEPGRDLGVYPPGHATFGYRYGIMTQFFGQTHLWQEWKSYDYNIYMTINGCSCWPGASIAPEGFCPGEYEQ